ncbi:acetylcholinesterase-like [Dendronephthya gigantea]|uniref:acetylcholinesterase-like n=1 Tax=Dendronephthya gigantea TaxID=151771 RepID=UPI00106C1C3C|nr:acetylcholinesterase-like [Dendronephthya gigantea]
MGYLIFALHTVFCIVEASVNKGGIPGHKYLPIVQTVHGIIQGQTVISKDGRYSHQYLGIPYATPPIGHLRFQKPQPYTGQWSGVLDASMFQPSCMQPRLPRSGRRAIDIWNPENEFKENCLTLNIWTPYPRRTNSSVMVWIHGDSFIKGSSSLPIHNGKTLASHGDVIVVTFNYRLGALGFLATGDNRIEGNMGLYDQRMALFWVKKNIQVFGGNPNSITIFGESSGAASVGFHLLAQSGENLFHRAILQSGSPIAYWASMSKAQASQRLKKFLKKLKCEDDGNLRNCLSQIPAEVIVRAQQDLASVQFGHFTWVPVIDHILIGDNPRYLIKNLPKKKVNVLLGTNKNEGSRWMVYLLNFLRYKRPFKLKTKQLRSLIDQVFYELSDAARSKIKEFYFKFAHNKTTPTFNRDLYQILLEDRHMYCPMLDMAKALSGTDVNDVFMYRMKHRSRRENWPKWMGVVHGTDLQYVLGAPIEEPRVFNDKERKLSLRMMSYWSNFAKYGNPTAGQRNVLPKWPKFENTTGKFVKFKVMDNLEIGQNFRDENCAIWREIETEALEYESDKKSIISEFPSENEAFDIGESFYYNVF